MVRTFHRTSECVRCECRKFHACCTTEQIACRIERNGRGDRHFVVVENANGIVVGADGLNVDVVNVNARCVRCRGESDNRPCGCTDFGQIGSIFGWFSFSGNRRRASFLRVRT